MSAPDVPTRVHAACFVAIIEPMSALDDRIDALYELPLTEFTAARNALAKSAGGADAARIKRLEKPTVVAWAVNQIYWRDRMVWTRLMRAGQALRTAQINALKGRDTDVRAASVNHRTALTAAVQRATELAATRDAHPAADQMARMLEALSLAGDAPDRPGRFTDVIQPSGFEALAGVTPVGRATPAPTPPEPVTAAAKARPATTTEDAAKRAAAERAAARKSAEAAVEAAHRDVERATASDARAQARVDDVVQQLRSAEAERDRARADVDAARAALDGARRHLEQL